MSASTITVDGDPREALAQALQSVQLAEAVHPERPMAATAAAAKSAAWAAIAQAQAMLQPNMDEVIEAATEEALAANGHAVETVTKLHALLVGAVQSGPRHPALSAALRLIQERHTPG